MPPKAPFPHPTEIEIKLALPVANPTDADTDGDNWASRLAKAPALAECKAVHRQVYSVYYDTPDQALRGQRTALRLRRVGPPEQPQWLQTLKTTGQSDSALTQRGEWEMPVPGPALALDLFEGSPWPRIDKGGGVSAQLAPCFVTDFERTTWQIQKEDGSKIEVALDIGSITALGHSTPLCEIELELLSGPPSALFVLALELARTMAVLPLAASKAQRGYALLEAGLRATALHAHPPKVLPHWTVATIARRILGEMFLQFTANLHALQTTNDPELIHQARVGWRRFRSFLRFLRPVLHDAPFPDRQALGPLLNGMGVLRDLDVALTETLPMWANRYIQGDASRAQHWQSLQESLTQARQHQHTVVCQALAQPPVGQALLAITQWLETLETLEALDGPVTEPRTVKHWVRHRIERLANRLEDALHAATHAPTGIDGADSTDSVDPHLDLLHRARILAKRLRYNTEALAPLLSGRLEQKRTAAVQWQENLGAGRDLAQASVLAARVNAAPVLVEFLRGVAAGHAQALGH